MYSAIAASAKFWLTNDLTMGPPLEELGINTKGQRRKNPLIEKIMGLKNRINRERRWRIGQRAGNKEQNDRSEDCEFVSCVGQFLDSLKHPNGY